MLPCRHQQSHHLHYLYTVTLSRTPLLGEGYLAICRVRHGECKLLYIAGLHPHISSGPENKPQHTLILFTRPPKHGPKFLETPTFILTSSAPQDLREPRAAPRLHEETPKVRRLSSPARNLLRDGWQGLRQVLARVRADRHHRSSKSLKSLDWIARGLLQPKGFRRESQGRNCRGKCHVEGTQITHSFILEATFCRRRCPSAWIAKLHRRARPQALWRNLEALCAGGMR